MNKDKLTDNSTNKADSLPQPPGNFCGSPVSTNTKANGEKNALAKGAKSKQELCDEFWKLAKKTDDSSEIKKQDVWRMKQIVVAVPELWPVLADSTGKVLERLIEKTSKGIAQAGMLAEMDILKKQFDYDNSSVLERMLIDHVLAARVRLNSAENRFSNIMYGESSTAESVKFWEDILASAQIRFLRASEALARVRRLARITPAMQINIAQAGSKQVNVQSDTP